MVSEGNHKGTPSETIPCNFCIFLQKDFDNLLVSSSSCKMQVTESFFCLFDKRNQWIFQQKGNTFNVLVYNSIM